MKKIIFFLSFLFAFSLLAKSQARYQPWFKENPPNQYKGSQIVEVTFKTSQKAIKKLVPEPLIPNSDNIMSISIGRQIIPSLSSEGYLEMYATIPVEYDGKSGQYWAILYLEDHCALTAGRERFGFPKFGADIEFEKKDNKVSASIVRYGTELLELSADLGKTNSKTTTINNSLGFTVKEIPSVEENRPPAILQLNSVNFRNVRYYDYQECNDLVFKLFEVDPGHMPNLPVEEVISAVFYKMDFILDYGKVEYDYLRNNKTKSQTSIFPLSQKEISEFNDAIKNHPLFSMAAQRFEYDELLNLFKNYKINCHIADSLWESNQSTLDKINNLGVTEKFELIPLSEYLVSSDSLIGENGVSYFIKTDDANILFDVGLNSKKQHPSPLIHNMEKLGISIDDIDIIVISHNHLDHVGGAWGQKNTFSLTNYQMKLNGVKVYTPCEMNYPRLPPIHSAKPTKISEGVATIGVIHNPCFFMDIAEQSLAFNVKDKGIIIISGCGHQSVSKILARTNLLFNEPIYGILGGLHYPVEVGRNITPVLKMAIRKLPWENFTIEDVKKDILLLKNSKIKIAGLSAHDSCDKSISAFKDEFGDEYYDIQVGKKISF